MTSVTIGLPVHQGLEEFKLAVKSIFFQSYQDWKLIIVCDGASEEIVKCARLIDDPRVSVIVHENSKGLPICLNEITMISTSEYVFRMDADDVMCPNRVQIQVKFLMENPGIDVLGGGSLLINEYNEVMGRYSEPKLPSSVAGFFTSGVFSHPTTVLRREWAIENPYDTDWVRTEDKELWLRTCGSSIFRKIPDETIFCRVPVNFSVEKQALTSKFDRKLLLKYGFTYGVPVVAFYKILKSYIKQIIFQAMVAMKLQRMIIKHKYEPIGEKQKQEAEETIRNITKMYVPGW